MRSPDPRRLRLPALAAAAALLGGCSLTPRTAPGDDAPTLATLAQRPLPAVTRARLPSSEDAALRAWQDLLAAQPPAALRARALRRLGDLEMDRADAALAGDAPADYRAAVARYQDYLRAYPQDPGNDRVLYQLARAHEQAGDLDAALAVLDRLVQQYPRTATLDEAQFRRGELLFTARRYADAERAYAQVLASATPTPYQDRALYMQGWSQFKQARLDAALESFLRVLDDKLAGQDDTVALEALDGLGRADRELLDDTFRVLSLTLENLQGAASIEPVTRSPVRQAYQVRLYDRLAALYLKQDRPKDAADALETFVRLRPQHDLAPMLQQRVIAIHTEAGFDQQALAAQRDFVTRYGADGPYRQANPPAWARAQPQVRDHLAALARQAHAQAQKTRQRTDVQAAARWYETLLREFPADAQAAQHQFLLAELLFEDGRYGDAARAYDAAAYDHPPHDRSAEAGYASVLARAEQLKGATAEARPPLQRAEVDSALRFARQFPQDARSAPVLAHAAEQLYQLGDAPAAAAAARDLLQRQPAAADEPRRIALNVLAHTRFEAGEFAQAEADTQAVLALTPAASPARAALAERLAAAIYRQAEQARDRGDTAQAAELFTKVTTAAPQSAIRGTAQFDAATQRLRLRDWATAAALLEDFRQRAPRDPLQSQVPAKLALAYGELGRRSEAAAEYERVAAAATDAETARAARWQAATLLDQAQAQPGAPASARASAARAWEAYGRAHPSPVGPALEAMDRLAALAHAEGATARERSWQRQLLQTEAAAGEQRSARTRSLATQAALALASDDGAAYRQVALVEPLQKSLAAKKARLETALQAYARVADLGVPEAVTAATFHTASLYQDFGQALMASQRPRKLSKLELEQYNVMLEEQAYPFEEKAIGLHETNAAHTTEGLYDRWVQQSLAALRTLRPARWAKTEREDEAATEQGERHRKALALRRQGDFAGALEAWNAALAQQPDDAQAHLNLGVLHDLYLGHPAEALARYERFQALQAGGPDPQVAKWIAEVRRRAAPSARPVTPPTEAQP